MSNKQPKLQHFSPEGLKNGKRLSNSSRIILVEAEKQGISWEIIPGTKIVSMEYAGKHVSYYHQIPSTTTALAEHACANKHTTNNLLRAVGIATPKGYQVTKTDTAEYIKKVYNSLQKPLAIKPTDGNQGDNISLNVSSYPEYQRALELAFAHAGSKSTSLVEEMFQGKEYRILATQEKVVGIVNRIPANVIGDGESSIRQLIEHKNKEKIRRAGTQSHCKINIDADLRSNLEMCGMTVASIPKLNQQVFLRTVSNVSKGGEAIDCTDLAHPSVNAIALEAMEAIPGLSLAGIDFITADITKQQTDHSYVIIELNTSPGFDIHDAPYQGKNRHAAREFLYLLFPKLKKTVRQRANRDAIDTVPVPKLLLTS
ncbi:MAG: hypothetical protein WDZ94_02860 [Patescibacteria group bacterium]